MCDYKTWNLGFQLSHHPFSCRSITEVPSQVDPAIFAIPSGGEAVVSKYRVTALTSAVV